MASIIYLNDMDAIFIYLNTVSETDNLILSNFPGACTFFNTYI